jgi:Uma2 family endonuclease
MPEALQRVTVSGTEPPRQHAVLRDISWATYEALLSDHLDCRWPRFVFDEGILEIMTPSPKHDRIGTQVQKFIDVVIEEWELDILNVGHATMRRRDLNKGFEADASIYIQNASAMRPRDEIDLSMDPPPDLVVEIEVSRSALDKLGIYARVGVSEVWRCDAKAAIFHILHGDRYQESSTSVALPGVTTQVLMDFVSSSWELTNSKWIRSVREWARAQRPR